MTRHDLVRATIYNDCEGAWGNQHFGTKLVMDTYRAQLDSRGVEVVGTVRAEEAVSGEYDKRLLDADLVIVNGEGSYHHCRRPDIPLIAEQSNAILVNTVFDTNDTHRDLLNKFRFISVRESWSGYRLDAKAVPHEVIPDVILASNHACTLPEHHDCRNQTIVIEHSGNNSTLRSPGEVVNDIASCAALVTCSYHAALVALSLGKPFGLWKSNSIKNHGLAYDARGDCAQNFAEAQITNDWDYDYPARGRQLVSRLFDRIADGCFN